MDTWTSSWLEHQKRRVEFAKHPWMSSPRQIHPRKLPLPLPLPYGKRRNWTSLASVIGSISGRDFLFSQQSWQAAEDGKVGFGKVDFF